jgi:hypothetical protein
MTRQALRLALLVGLLALVWTGVSAAGSGVMQCPTGPIPCSSFDRFACVYNLDAHGCCVTHGLCPNYCCAEQVD